jgi:uncharacterized protein YcaQ
MAGTDGLSAREARWLAIGAQGLGAPIGTGERGPGIARLGGLLGPLGTIQLDAVNVLERTQFLVPFSRLGPYDRSLLGRLTGPGRPWFEYWGHAASLLAVENYPLFRPRMEGTSNDGIRRPLSEERRRRWRAANAEYLKAVLAEITARGPLPASQLADPRRRIGEWWDRRSDGRRALESLFTDGVLAAWRSDTFERVYDLAERVIPADVLARPTPSPEEADRELVAIAAHCLGVATVADLANYFWLSPVVARLRAAELVEEGRLTPVAVEGWRQPAYTPRLARPRRPRRDHATLLSPFDSLIWFRERTERLFDFHYRIEIYVPEPKRRFGYYVLPMLLGDELVARFDLKADRRSSALLVVSAHLEAGAEAGVVAPRAADELVRLGGWLGLDTVAVAGKGALAAPLRRALTR